MVEHVNIPDSGRHEPKGASTAATGQLLVANGDGSTSWAPPTSVLSPADFYIERIISSESLASNQFPVALDTALQVEFGAAANGPSDPVQLLTGGGIQFNEGGLYRFKAGFQVGRTGQTGISVIHLRILLNGTQVGRSLTSRLQNADDTRLITDESWYNISAGDLVTYEIIRDSDGANSGGLVRYVPTPAGWSPSPSAAIRVERFVAN